MPQVLSAVIAVVAVVLLIRLLTAPIRWIWKICINTLAGGVMLALINLLAPVTGLYIDITLVRGCIVGFLGLPGLALVVLMQLFV